MGAAGASTPPVLPQLVRCSHLVTLFQPSNSFSATRGRGSSFPISRDRGSSSSRSYPTSSDSLLSAPQLEAAAKQFQIKDSTRFRGTSHLWQQIYLLKYLQWFHLGHHLCSLCCVPSPPSSSRILSSPQMETSYPLSS